MHEPLLYFLLTREQRAQEPVLLKIQDSKSMALRHCPDTSASKDFVGQDRCHAVEAVVYDPVEHLYQEGEPLQDATVYIVLELGSVGRLQCDA